jgi:hypothetical protein
MKSIIRQVVAAGMAFAALGCSERHTAVEARRPQADPAAGGSMQVARTPADQTPAATGAYADPGYQASIVGTANMPDPLPIELPSTRLEPVRRTSGRFAVEGRTNVPRVDMVQAYKQPELSAEERKILGIPEEFDELKAFYRSPAGPKQGVQPLFNRPYYATSSDRGGAFVGSTMLRYGATQSLDDAGRNYGVGTARSGAESNFWSNQIVGTGESWGMTVGDGPRRQGASHIRHYEGW